MAKEKGFYKDVGIDVEFKEYEFGTNISRDVSEGKSDFGVDGSSLILDKIQGLDVYLLIPFLQTSPFVYRPIKKIVSVDGINNKLTAIESELLEFLILNKGSIVTKKMVEDKIYLFKEMSDVALKNIIYKLRKKLIKDVIVSVDRIGYKIN